MNNVLEVVQNILFQTKAKNVLCCYRCRGGALTGGTIPAGSGSKGEPTELPQPFCPPASDNTADTP